jgi:hypothetical protein
MGLGRMQNDLLHFPSVSCLRGYRNESKHKEQDRASERIADFQVVHHYLSSDGYLVQKTFWNIWSSGRNDCLTAIAETSLLQSCVSLLQRVAVSNFRSESGLPMMVLEQLQGGIDMPWLEAPAADHLELLPGNRMWIHQHLACVCILAEHKVFSSIPYKLPTFWYRRGTSNTLDNEISTVGTYLIE